jgi:site-specific DNA recombinase
MDQAKEHAEAIKRLQAEYDRIQSRIQPMYIDKLDAKVDPGIFEHLSADWRKQQNRCLREIERRQSADQHYLEEDVTILEMARNAQRLFDSGTDAEAAAPQFRCFELHKGEMES